MTLIDRLSKLDGPDREVDWLIADHFAEIPKHTIREIGWDYDWWRGPNEYSLKKAIDSEGRRIDTWSPNAYTASVDEAIALARRLWPDVMYRVGNDGEGPDPSLYLGEIFIPGEQKDSYFTGLSPVDAVGLCIAILRAKEASKP